MGILSNAFFWVALSLLGMLAGNAIAGQTTVGNSKTFGIATITTVLLPRFIIPLAFIEQTRFHFEFQYAVGGALMVMAILFWVPLYKILWATSPSQRESLKTSGVYGLVRHPGYLGDILIVLGWSVCLGSVTGVLLTPLWLAAFYMHSLIEENSLLEEYGDQYQVYKSRVKSRILPCVPF